MTLHTIAPVDAAIMLPQNAPVPFNSGTGRENPIAQADNRRYGGFFTSVHRYWCAFSMAGRSGASFGWAGTLCAGFSPLLRACHPRREKRLAGEIPAQEATMPSFALRAVRALFPIRRLAFALYRHRAISALSLVRMIGGAA